jgi:hypothetical protein
LRDLSEEGLATVRAERLEAQMLGVDSNRFFAAPKTAAGH